MAVRESSSGTGSGSTGWWWTDAGGWLAYGAVDGGTRVIDLETEEVSRDFTLDRRPILAMAYHAASSQLAVGDGQGYIMMIDTAPWKITRDFHATRQGPVWASGVFAGWRNGLCRGA